MDFLLTKACCVSDDVIDNLRNLSEIEELRKEEYDKYYNNINCTPDLDRQYQDASNLNRRNLPEKKIHLPIKGIHLPIEIPEKNMNDSNHDFSHYFKMENTIDFRGGGFSKKELILLDKMMSSKYRKRSSHHSKVPDDENKEQD